MLRGLHDSWKFVLEFFVTEHAVDANTSQKLLMDCLKVANELNFNVKAITCDQASGNRLLYKNMTSSTSSASSNHLNFNRQKIYLVYEINC